MTYIPLSYVDLAVAASLLVANGAISMAFRLGLEKSLLVASLRLVVQLGLVALALNFIFEATSPWLTAGFALVMGAGAAYEVHHRQEMRIAGPLAVGLGAVTPFIAGLIATLFASLAIIEPDPWYAPRYVLPVFGMMLGNTLAGTSLVLDTLTQGIVRERGAIEARLALGATRFEALDQVLRRALTTALMPILSSMAATGLVTLPGMMTGQILSGVDPISAAKYQVVIMFLISGATGLAVVGAGLGAVLLLTDDRHRLRLERLQRRA